MTSLSATANLDRASLAQAQAADPEKRLKEQAKLRQASRMFEAHFLHLLTKEMRKTVNKSGFMGGGYAEEMFTDLLDQNRAEQASAGRSMGIASMLEAQLGRERVKRPSAARMKLPSADQAQGQEFPAYPAVGQPTPSYRNSLWRGRIPQPQGPDFMLPVSGAEITSGFGPRLHPITGQERDHLGVDLAAPIGTPVKAAAEGVVSQAGPAADLGNLVVITHADGATTHYGHLERIAVQPGQKVARGQQVATVGDTGLSTGPHLHFEIRDAAGQARDPLTKLAMGVDRGV
ncbi:MAG: peptidoglycan DD-metalloendopeptidase family protein [Thermodesulfobacteriota bacterium]